MRKSISVRKSQLDDQRVLCCRSNPNGHRKHSVEDIRSGIGLRRDDPALRSTPVALSGKGLDRAHRKALADNSLRESSPSGGAIGHQYRPRVTFGNCSVHDHLLDLVWQLKKANEVADRRATSAKTIGHNLMGLTKILQQDCDGAGDFNGVQVLPDHVLNEPKFKSLTFISVTNQRWYLRESGSLGGPPATFPSDQLIATTGQGSNNDRLNEPAGLNRSNEGSQRVGVDFAPWLVSVWPDCVNRHPFETRSTGVRSARLAKEGIQSSAEPGI